MASVTIWTRTSQQRQQQRLSRRVLPSVRAVVDAYITLRPDSRPHIVGLTLTLRISLIEAAGLSKTSGNATRSRHATLVRR
jgi:hypothetical protein